MSQPSHAAARAVAPREALLSALGAVAEHGFFGFVNGADAPEYDARLNALGDAPLRRVSVRFSGPADGDVEAIAPRDLGAELWRACLGASPEDAPTDAQADDALGELVNLATGVWLDRMWADATFQLAPPVVSSASPAASNRAPARDAIDVYAFVNDLPVRLTAAGSVLRAE
jgi:hypothetical protein